MRTILPRYVERVSAKGHHYYYFRRRGVRWRLPGSPGDLEFEGAYLDRLRATLVEPLPRKIGESTVSALVRDYKSSDEFLALSVRTRTDYCRMLDHLAPLGQFLAADIRRSHVRALRTKFAGKSRTQHLFVQVTSALFTFGMQEETYDVESNPAAKFKRLGRATSYRRWSEPECAAFEASKPPQHIVTAYMLARYAGQRRGDVLRMTRSAFDGEVFELRQAKTDEPLVLPVHWRLRTYLGELPRDALLFVVDQQRKPLREETFSKQFRAALDRAGLQHLHFHGLRHTAASALAEAGCTDKEIMAITGHRTFAMVQHYTSRTNQKHLASVAIAKLERTGTEPECAKPVGKNAKREVMDR